MSTATSAGILHLAKHVHVCACEGSTILLDLRRDKYMGLGPIESRAVATIVEGWPIPPLASMGSITGTESEADISTLLSNLAACGVLTEHGDLGKSANPVTVPRSLRGVLYRRDARCRPSDVWGFFSACIVSWILQRFRSLEYCTHRVQRRKLLRAQSRGPNAERVAHVATLYMNLRPFLFTAKDACLADSLVLLEYFARYDIYPTWVIGVQSGPFAAHSWVQDGDVVLNDTPERVLQYTPIMAV